MTRNHSNPVSDLPKIVFVALVVFAAAFGALAVYCTMRMHSGPLDRLHILRSKTMIFYTDPLFPSTHGRTIYKRDALGLRGPYKNPAHIDILTMGGSAVDQRMISEGETWQEIMAQDLARQGIPLTIVNAGVEGQSTVGILSSFESWLPWISGLKPKYFIFYVGYNDFFMVGGEKYDAVTLMEQQKASLKTVWRSFRQWLETVRKMCIALTTRLPYERIDFRKEKWVERRNFENIGHFFPPALLEGYHQRLIALARRAREYGATPIFVIQPMHAYRMESGKLVGVPRYRYRGEVITGADVYAIVRVAADEAMRACREAGGICIDLASRKDFEDTDFYDFVHNTPSGARKIGLYLAEDLAPHFRSNPEIGADIKR